MAPRLSLPAAKRGRNAKRDQPDLSESVIASEMSANAAAIEAGFRKEPSPLAQRIVNTSPTARTVAIMKSKAPGNRSIISLRWLYGAM
jgi:hypothetical protein